MSNKTLNDLLVAAPLRGLDGLTVFRATCKQLEAAIRNNFLLSLNLVNLVFM